jgi:tetratricopeptide (TPR) repeat protein
VLLAAGRGRAEPGGSGRTLLALGVAAIAITVVGSLAAPWLAERRVQAAYDAIDRGDLDLAADDAADAAALNPLSIEPLHVEALARELNRQLDAAQRLYIEAVDLQPDNPETWYELGRFEFQSRGDLGAALRYLDRSYGLDAYGPSGPLLDEVRAEIARQTSESA